MNEEIKDSDDNRISEEVLCPNCAQVNKPLIHFCIKCGAPLSSFANVGPWERIQSEGFAYRQAVGGPPKKIILIGIWLIFAPTLFAMVIYPLFFALNGALSKNDLLPLSGMLLMGSFSAIILFRTTKNYITKKRMVEQCAGGDSSTRADAGLEPPQH